MIDLLLPEFAVVCVSTCKNRLPSEPPKEFCMLSLCIKLFNASTKNCVAATTVEGVAWLVAAAFNIAVSNIKDADSNCPRPEMSTMSKLLVSVVADVLNTGATG
jgi:hypothetical protein